jgi:hypothetical protein
MMELVTLFSHTLRFILFNRGDSRRPTSRLQTLVDQRNQKLFSSLSNLFFIDSLFFKITYEIEQYLFSCD